jgi:hypothetical protein
VWCCKARSRSGWRGRPTGVLKIWVGFVRTVAIVCMPSIYHTRLQPACVGERVASFRREVGFRIIVVAGGSLVGDRIWMMRV